MLRALSESATAGIQETIDEVTAEKNRIQALIATVVGRDGRTIFSHACGTKGCDSSEPMNLDTALEIVSCAKMIGRIAAM